MALWTLSHWADLLLHTSWSLWEVRCVLTSWWGSKLFSVKNFKEVASLAFCFIPFGGSCFAFTLEKIIFHTSVSPSCLERMSQKVYLLLVSCFLFGIVFVHLILLHWYKASTLLGTWIKNQRGNRGQKGGVGSWWGQSIHVK